MFVVYTNAMHDITAVILGGTVSISPHRETSAKPNERGVDDNAFKRIASNVTMRGRRRFIRKLSLKHKDLLACFLW